MQRNSSMAEMYADAINTAKSEVSKPNIRKWFQELYKYLETELDLTFFLISVADESLFNADERCFKTRPKKIKALEPISFNNLYEIKPGNENESITMMATFNTTGDTHHLLNAENIPLNFTEYARRLRNR